MGPMEIPINEKAIETYAKGGGFEIRNGVAYIVCPYCGDECKAALALASQEDDETGDDIVMPRISFAEGENTVQLHLDVIAHAHDHECGQITQLHAAVRGAWG